MGSLQLNTEAAVREGSEFRGVGAVIRDHTGAVVACLSRKIHGSFSPVAAECLAIREGLLFAVSCGLKINIVETDA